MRTVISIFVVLLVFSPSLAYTQDLGGASAIGLRGGATHYDGDDFKAALPKATGRFLLEHYFSNRISLEGSVGAGEVAARTGDRRFRTRQYGFGLAWRLGLLPGEQVRPYITAGADYYTFDIKQLTGGRETVDPTRDNASGYFALPLGGGISFRLSQVVTLDFRGSYAVAFDDLYDGTDFGSKNDNFFSAAAGITLVLRSAAEQDIDNDGLLTKEEKKFRTDPKVADTDGDGLNDGAEILTYASDPLNRDTDGDGLTDGEEATTYKTDPRKADTDGDGLSDREEVKQLRTNPLELDTDKDGLADNEERRVWRTDPTVADTDRDKLSDGDEVHKYKTNPTLADSDNDGLDDYQEVVVLETNPLVADKIEAEEPQSGLLAARDATPTVRRGEKLQFGAITFRSGSAVLLPESNRVIQSVYDLLKSTPGLRLAINGYTDSAGNIIVNMRLSQVRAEAVRNALVDRGIAPDRLLALGFGSRNPVASNATAEGRAQNRRIEFVVR